MGKKKKDISFWNTAQLNNRTYLLYLDRLTEIAVSSFKYENLPESMDARFLETTIFRNGCAVIFEDDVLGMLGLPVAISGTWNVYNIPVRRRAYANNGYQRELSINDSVIIYDNYLHNVIYPTIELYANRLYNLDRIIDVNANAQKRPRILCCDENQRLTLENIFKEIDGNAPKIFASKNIDIQSLNPLDISSPYISDKIYELKMRYWNEALGVLGVSNISVEKKERLLRDEINQLMGGALISRRSRLMSRQQALEQVNNMFNLHISVEYIEEEPESGVISENEQIHDGTSLYRRTIGRED